jgi:hypothetical protein
MVLILETRCRYYSSSFRKPCFSWWNVMIAPDFTPCWWTRNGWHRLVVLDAVMAEWLGIEIPN